MKRTILPVLAVIFCLWQAHSQEAGATFYSGVTVGKTHDPIVSKEGQYQSGYLVGLDARLNDGGLYFMLSGEYGKFDLMSQETISITKGEKFSFFKGRTGLGFKLFGNEKVFVSSKLQASFDIVLNYNNDFLKPTEYQINDGFLGAATGIGLNIYALFVELEYEHGILNLYYEKPETIINFYTLKVGVKF
ncbi:MAG: hypothetical protein KDC49_12970 [Saprospiraceae bacterium]|nr:hypothetical protein [Saprospiraceae bacterium]